MSSNASQSLSIVVPVYNEEDNIHPLVDRVHHAMQTYAHPWELIIVDDGSSDATWQRLKETREQFGDHVRAFELNRNFGQTAAMQAGLDHVRGDLVDKLDCQVCAVAVLASPACTRSPRLHLCSTRTTTATTWCS